MQQIHVAKRLPTSPGPPIIPAGVNNRKEVIQCLIVVCRGPWPFGAGSSPLLRRSGSPRRPRGPNGPLHGNGRAVPRGGPSSFRGSHSANSPMTEIYVDSDGCPVKEEVLKVASRHGLVAHYVSDRWQRGLDHPLVRKVVVAQGADAADDWIAERIGPEDIAVTTDIPLATVARASSDPRAGHSLRRRSAWRWRCAI